MINFIKWLGVILFVFGTTMGLLIAWSHSSIVGSILTAVTGGFIIAGWAMNEYLL